jgi:hypothetical protein
MSWKAIIAAKGPTWHATTEYADERIAELTGICVLPESSEAEIRAAQAGISEMLRLKGLPDQLKSSAEMTEISKRRKGRGY